MNDSARQLLYQLSLTIGLCLVADAAEFYQIEDIESNTSATDFYPANRLIQGPGQGFDENEPHDSLSADGQFLWVTQACAYPCDYFAEGLTAPSFRLDLGQDQLLDEISIWNFYNDNSAKRFHLRFATEEDGGNGFGNTIAYSPSFTAANIGWQKRQSFAFGRAIRARYVLLTISDNYFRGDGINGGDRVGFGEVAFEIPDQDRDRLVVTAPGELSAVTGNLGNDQLHNLLTGENYWSAVLSESERKVYFSVPTDGKIYAVSLDSDPPVANVFVASDEAVFHGLAINEAEGILLALDSGADTLRQFRLQDGAELNKLASGFLRPNEILLDEGANRLVISDSGLDQLIVLDLEGEQLDVLDHLSTEGVWGLAVDPETGELLYSSHDLGEIWRWQPGGTPVREHAGLDGPRGLGFDRWGRLYCVESGRDRVVTPAEENPTSYQSAPAGRDIALIGVCDTNANLLPDDWENKLGAPDLTFYGDADQDGILDGAEAAMGGSVTGGPNGYFALQPGSTGEITLAHWALAKSDFEYQLFLSEDLEEWLPIEVLPSVQTVNDFYELWTYTINLEEVKLSPSGQVFAQLDILPVAR
ncbi:MAG: hypothetical protein Q7Q71_12430 [Verrucomicrobiota bacterium JB023]|nr:hypothetical protein [Verrucomicrobiota bacterium JB023]